MLDTEKVNAINRLVEAVATVSFAVERQAAATEKVAALLEGVIQGKSREVLGFDGYIRTSPDRRRG